jgi:hypothetical protein
MTITEWLAAAKADAEKRGLTGLAPLLESLARSTAALREADNRPNLGSEAAHAPSPEKD